MNTFTLIKKDGTQIKTPYTVVDGVEMITGHFSRAEFDTGHEKNALFFEPSLLLLEHVRIKAGVPIEGSSGFRSSIKQKLIWNQYLADCKAQKIKPIPGTVANPEKPFPHGTGAAFDLFRPENMALANFIYLFRGSCRELNLPLCRIGWKDYANQPQIYRHSFIHVDLVFMLYTPYTEISNPHPTYWKAGVEW